MDGYAFRSVLGSVPNGPCFSRVEHVERVEWLMKGRSRKVCGWLFRGGIAAEMNVRQAYTVIRKGLV